MQTSNEKSCCSSKWTKSCLGWIPARFVFTCLTSFGIMNVYIMRINLSVALVAMVKTAPQLPDNGTECSYDSSSNNATSSAHVDNGEFDWDEVTQGIILGSFFWGYIFTQIPGGRMAELYSAKWVFGLGILCTSVFTLLTPVAARAGQWWLVAVRVAEGLGEGVTFPTVHVMVSRWCPPNERSRTIAVIYAGSLIGSMVGLAGSGWLAGLAGGWPSIFYVFGTSGIVWFVLWTFFAYDSPETHTFINNEEKEYIRQSFGSKKLTQSPPVPYLKVITSLPVWAIIVSHFCHNWGFYTLLTQLPTYLKTILHYDMEQNGLLSALPYLMASIFSAICSVVCDLLIKRKILTTTTARKLFQFLGDILPAACMFGITFTNCDRKWPVAFLVLSVMTGGATFAGYTGNHIDIAPNFAGTLQGLTNTIATIPGWLGPYTVGAIIKNKPYKSEWDKVFYIAGALYIFSGVFYVIFGKGFPQPWNFLEGEEASRNEVTNNELDDDIHVMESKERLKKFRTT